MATIAFVQTVVCLFFEWHYYNLPHGANTAFRSKTTLTSGSPVNTLMFLSQLQPTRPNTERTSILSWILRRKHATLISFLVSSGICSRLLGMFILNRCCHGSTYFFCIENMQKFPGKEPLNPQTFQMLRLKLQNRNGLISCFQRRINSCVRRRAFY